MCSRNSTKMILLGLTLSCMILNVIPQQFPLKSGEYPRTHSLDNVYFQDRPIEYPIGSIPPSAIQYPQYYNPTILKHNVQVEKSKEISSSTTVQQGNINNEKEVTNYPNAVRPGYEQVAHGQVIGSPTIQPLVPSTDKYNGLLFSVMNVGINVLKTMDSMVAGNVVVSPYSISLLLSLLQQGARGQTQSELTTVLGMTHNETAIGYSKISADYKTRNSRSILDTATGIFVGEQYSINRDFKKLALENFDSDITPAPYTRPEEAARKINKWVEKKTHNRIENLINPDGLDPNTQVVLVNTIFFKGLWEVPFRPKATLSREFHLSSGETKSAQFMRMRNYTQAGVDPNTNAKVVILPFVDKQYSMMLVLPSANVRFSNWLARLTDARLLSYFSFSIVDVELEIPKFKVRGDSNLEIVLKRMGIQTMFSESAELNLVQSNQGYSQSSRISAAVHSAVLSIDEQGGTAAAATAFAAVALSYDEPSFTFKANKPFLVVLWDNISGMPLFMAKVEDPTLL